jgi:hypothetical protein
VSAAQGPQQMILGSAALLCGGDVALDPSEHLAGNLWQRPVARNQHGLRLHHAIHHLQPRRLPTSPIDIPSHIIMCSTQMRPVPYQPSWWCPSPPDPPPHRPAPARTPPPRTPTHGGSLPPPHATRRGPSQQGPVGCQAPLSSTKCGPLTCARRKRGVVRLEEAAGEVGVRGDDATAGRLLHRPHPRLDRRLQAQLALAEPQLLPTPAPEWPSAGASDTTLAWLDRGVCHMQVEVLSSGLTHQELADPDFGCLKPRLLDDVLARDAHVHIPLPCQ